MFKRLRQFFFATLLLFFCNHVVEAQLIANFSTPDTSGCNPLVATFQDQSTGNPVSWRWTLGNGSISTLQNPSATYFTPGVYSVKLVITNAAGLKDSLTKTQYITVNDKPVVNFTVNKRTGCFPLQVQFTDLSSVTNGTITKWLWDFGDGFTSTLQNPGHTYTAQGVYTVTLFATSNNGCVNTEIKNNYITISDGVIAGFTFTPPLGCTQQQTISFQNTSTGTGILTYQWSFGDGNTSTLTNPVHTYSTSGSFTVSLIVINSSGCRDTLTRPNVITVGSRVPDFSFIDNVCTGSPANFLNTSTPLPLSSAWQFGDGTTSAQMNPVKVYNAPGTFMVRLINSYSACKDTVVKSISILPKPTAAFTGIPIVSCQAPLTVSFTNNSLNSNRVEWIFGDGSGSSATDPTHTYTANGSYTVTLIATGSNGCTDTLVKSNYIQIQEPIVDFSSPPDSGCAPLVVSFIPNVTSVDPVVSYLWNFGDGNTSTQSNPTHTYPVGVYTVQLIITTAGGCTDTVTKPASVIAAEKPTANLVASPLEACAKIPINFTDLSTGMINFWHWDFGDGSTSNDQNPIHNYDDTGRFTITLIVGNSNCFDTIVFPNYIHILPPIARFITDPDCLNKYYRSFTDNSIGADQWFWDFGDGNTSTVQNPVHTYSATGTYIVVLRVINNVTGCDHERSQDVIISDERADFTANQTLACKNVAVEFTADTSSTVNNIVNFQWDFGDGSQGSGEIVQHSYSSSGNYSVRLIIMDINGCTDTIVKDQYMRINGPAADFSPAVAGICSSSSVVFTDQSVTDGINAIETWFWDFGDGSSQLFTSPPFAHTYNTSGTYTVTLIVTDASGCTDSITKPNVLLVSTPMASFSSSDSVSCPGSTVSFLNTSTGPGLSYLWDFGDGMQSNLQNPGHIYTNEGLYTVRLTIRDQYSCVSTITKPQRIITPFSGFSVNDSIASCPPLLVNFTNISTNLQSFNWDFGDGSSSSALNPSHLYTTPGAFVVTLSITTNGGCTASSTKTIIIKGPSGSFNYLPLNGCVPFTATFRANTLNRSSFVWDFADGTTLATTDSVVTHTYIQTGNYVPKMILKNVEGCTVSVEGLDTVSVVGITGDFTTSTTLGCDSTMVQFTNNIVSTAAITGYLWDFGDGTSSTQASPSHLYNTPGLYYPRITATSVNGCVTSFALPLPIRIIAAPIADFNPLQDGCVPLTLSTAARLLRPDTSTISWKWYVDGAIVGTDSIMSPYSISQAGTHSIMLIATNSSGCVDTVVKRVEAIPIPVVDAGADDFICQGTGKQLIATGASNYAWSPAAGLSCASCASPIATPGNATLYKVAGTSAAGCTATDSVFVDVIKPLQISAGRRDTICIGSSVTLTASGAANYLWSPPAGLSAITGSTVQARPSINTTYRVVGTDMNRCFSDTAYFPIEVYPIPTVSLQVDTTISIGQTITLTPLLSGDVTNVLWQNPIGLVNTNYPSITVRPTGPSRYTVQVLNPGRCAATASVNISVKCTNGNVFIPNTFSPNGDGANDYFYVRGTGISQVKQMKIFNRWGEEVFSKYGAQANDIRGGWDGTFRGKKLSPDVFVYIVEILCEDNTTLTLFKGNIALIL